MATTTLYELPMPGAFGSVLRLFEAEEIDRLCLRPMQWEAGQRVVSMGQETRHIAFLETGAASLMVTFQDGRQVEAGFLHSESIIGLTALLGETISTQNVVMQVAGSGYVCRQDDALQEFERCGTFQRITLNRASVQIAETTQLVGCYALHQISQRLSRWLLTYQDRTGCKVITVTQEVLSQILGASRPTISIVSEMFARLGMIEVRRGKIRILDRPKLEAETCECYYTLRKSRNKKNPLPAVPYRTDVPVFHSYHP